MPSSAEGFARRGLRILRALALALPLAAGWGLTGAAQETPAGVPPEWDVILTQGVERTADPETPTAVLESLRDRLLRLRSAAVEAETAAAAPLADVNAQIEALGPAPAEGATEASDIAERRAQLNEELSRVQAPVLEAQDVQRRADALMRDIDRVVRARFAAELRSLGPSPLRPEHWAETGEAVTANVRRIDARVEATLADPVVRRQLLRQVPLDLALAIIGIGIAFSLRLRLVTWIEGALSRAKTAGAIALLANARNLGRLIVPAVGAGLLFAALDPAGLIDPGAPWRLFLLPEFLLAIIGAGWLGDSLFAPKLPAFRLIPTKDAAAASGARLVMGLGLVLAAKLLIRRYLPGWELTPVAAVTLEFPLFIVGGLLLWSVSRLLRTVRREVTARGRAAPPGDRAGSLALGLLGVVERGAWLIGIAAPVLAGTGYFAAASFLLYGAILTLGLFGTCAVLYDLVTKTLGAIGDRKRDAGGPPELAHDGMAPVLVGTLITLAALPLLALIWGARPSDLAGVWYAMRDGVALGGMRISVGMVASFVVVFAILYGLTRLLQSVLRNNVLPRTRMDAGGRNAVLKGVGYAGFALAVLAAVASTGINLTSLAFIAGALSLGIGFGLQNIVQNFVSGIILLAERPIKEGDWIEVGGFSGYVRGISVRSTEIETFDRASVIVPNSELVAGSVLNRTHTGMSGRLQVPVSVDLENDPRHVEAVLLEIAESYPLVLTEPSPRVLLMELGPDTMLFEIRCWLRDVNFSLSAKSDMNFKIMERFAAEGIRMQPFLRDPRHPPPAPAADAKQS